MSDKMQAAENERVGEVEPIVGIDLGTTNSLVAYCDERGPRVIADEEGRNLLPSVVRYDPETGRAVAVGYEAKLHAVEYARETVFSVKRLMGRGIEDVQEERGYLPYEVTAGERKAVRIWIGGRLIAPEEVSAEILRELRRRAERHLGRAVRKAVITVPAYFDDAQRQATRDAGRLAGLEVVRIINEPTAASLAYNLGMRHRDATVAVFDLGGGTFDFSILRLQQVGEEGQEQFVDQVLGTAGDTHLGGDDVDRMIVELMQKEIRQQFGEHIGFPPSTQQAMRNLAEAVKIRLSEEETAKVEVELGGGRVYRRELSRGELEAMMGPWLERAMACCRRALERAGVGVREIERVILVGGATRAPMVRRRVAEFFEQEPYTALNPEEVVALGAAVQGAILAGQKRDTLLLDVVPLSLGIETMGGAVAKLILANQRIPAKATEMFTTFVDGQTSVKIHVVQGERELAKDCRSLGVFELKGIPPMPAGLPRIEVTFLVDANGILSVSAVEQRSGKAASIQVVPSYGLTREEIRRMEEEAYAHAREDMQAHWLIDLKNQAQMDVRNIRRQLERVGTELEPEYRREIEAQVAKVEAFIRQAAPEPRAFQEALGEMDRVSVRLAELAVKKALEEGEAMSGGGQEEEEKVQ